MGRISRLWSLRDCASPIGSNLKLSWSTVLGLVESFWTRLTRLLPLFSDKNHLCRGWRHWVVRRCSSWLRIFFWGIENGVCDCQFTGTEHSRGGVFLKCGKCWGRGQIVHLNSPPFLVAFLRPWRFRQFMTFRTVDRRLRCTVVVNGVLMVEINPFCFSCPEWSQKTFPKKAVS